MMVFKHKLNHNAGMTIVEILMAVFILSVGMIGTLTYFITTKVAVQLARDQTTATVHAEYMGEEMRAMATLAEIIAADWEAFAEGAGLNTLSGEAIGVTFADEAADPLNITVNVNWVTNALAHNISLVTELTK